MGRKKPNPFNDRKVEQRDLPRTPGNKVLFSDPLIVDKLKHIAKPYRGGDTLEYNPLQVLADEELYVDADMVVLTLLNEVLHLRQQIGLVCKAAHEATNGMFMVNIDAPHKLPGKNNYKETAPYIEDYCYSNKKKK
jgi:hypothetical protein